MGLIMFCCEDKELTYFYPESKEFLSSTDAGSKPDKYRKFKEKNSNYSKDGVNTTVEFFKGSTLKLFCNYWNLTEFKKMKESYPSMANNKFTFYREEINRMLTFLQEKDSELLNNLLFYKIKFSGTVCHECILQVR